MCGINGFTFRDEEKINLMNNRISHRGPDDSGVYVDSQLSLGSVRLSIIDLSDLGHMPMKDNSGRYRIAYNGEIYNFKILKQKLVSLGYTFKSKTDTEVIVNLFHAYGKKAFHMLNGMFAIAIWDLHDKTLFLARDRVGIKPLYYIVHSNQLIFSSEIKSLFLHNIPKAINPTAMDLYMTLGYVPAPLTIFEGIKKVEPGQLVIWRNNRISKEWFWEISIKKLTKKTYREATHELRTLLADSIAAQMMADRALGVFLSGGIDSTVVASLAQHVRNQPIDTFSVGFSDVAEAEKFNHDFNLARDTAKLLGTNHHEFMIDADDACEIFSKLVIHKDEPIMNPTHIPTYALAEGTRNAGVVVALGGDGGDELFGGYPRYQEAMVYTMYQGIPRQIRHTLLDHLLVYLKAKRSPDIVRNLRVETVHEKYLAFMGNSHSYLSEVYKFQNKTHVKVLGKMRGFKQLESYPFHTIIQYLDLMHWLPEESLMRSDKMTMLWSLEQRVPLLDNRLIDFSLTIPFSWKVSPFFGKRILRDACDDLLPERIKKAPKRGFFSPGAKWLRRPEWQPLINSYFSTKALNETGYFNAKALQSLLLQHQQSKRYGYPILWNVLEFQAWYQQAYKKM